MFFLFGTRRKGKVLGQMERLRGNRLVCLLTRRYRCRPRMHIIG